MIFSALGWRAGASNSKITRPAFCFTLDNWVSLRCRKCTRQSAKISRGVSGSFDQRKLASACRSGVCSRCLSEGKCTEFLMAFCEALSVGRTWDQNMEGLLVSLWFLCVPERRCVNGMRAYASRVRVRWEEFHTSLLVRIQGVLNNRGDQRSCQMNI